jgi:hypothetical protein
VTARAWARTLDVVQLYYNILLRHVKPSAGTPGVVQWKSPSGHRCSTSQQRYCADLYCRYECAGTSNEQRPPGRHTMWVGGRLRREEHVMLEGACAEVCSLCGTDHITSLEARAASPVRTRRHKRQTVTRGPLPTQASGRSRTRSLATRVWARRSDRITPGRALDTGVSPTRSASTSLGGIIRAGTQPASLRFALTRSRPCRASSRVSVAWCSSRLGLLRAGLSTAYRQALR